MKKRFLCAVAVLVAALMATVAEAELKPALLSLEVVVSAQGKLPKEPDDFTVQLTASAAANPMPAGQMGGSCSAATQGPGKVVFPAMSFEHVGTYQYTVRELKGKNDKCVYDETVYNLTVTVVNNADYTGLEAVAVYTDVNGGPKPDNNLFDNVYKPDPANGNATPTGVVDRWPWCLAGCAALLGVSGVLATKLRRKEDDEAALAEATLDE